MNCGKNVRFSPTKRMQHAMRPASQPAQAVRLVQVAGQHRQPLCAQRSQPLRLAAQCQQLHAAAWHGLPHHARTDIATADYQQTLAAETGRPCARASGLGINGAGTEQGHGTAS